MLEEEEFQIKPIKWRGLSLSELPFLPDSEHTKSDEVRSRPKHNVRACAHTKSITAILVVDNYLLTASEDASVRVWDAGTRHFVGSFEGHTSRVSCLCVSHQQSRDRFFRPKSWAVLSGSDDKTVSHCSA